MNRFYSLVFLASLAALREMVLNLRSAPGIGLCPASLWNEEKRLKEKALASYCPTLDFGRYTVTKSKNNFNPRGLCKIQGILRAPDVRFCAAVMILLDRESGPPPSAHPPPTAASIPGRGAASRYQ